MLDSSTFAYSLLGYIAGRVIYDGVEHTIRRLITFNGGEGRPADSNNIEATQVDSIIIQQLHSVSSSNANGLNTNTVTTTVSNGTQTPECAASMRVTAEANPIQEISTTAESEAVAESSVESTVASSLSFSTQIPFEDGNFTSNAETTITPTPLIENGNESETPLLEGSFETVQTKKKPKNKNKKKKSKSSESSNKIDQPITGSSFAVLNNTSCP